MEEIKHACATNDTHKQNTSPVEILGRNQRIVRPEAPEKGPCGVAERDDIDGVAVFPKRPLRVRELTLLVPSPGDAANGDDIGAHERSGAEGKDGVEGDGGADVDEGESHREDAGEDDAVDRDVPFRVHLREPAAEGETVVTGKGEGLARGGCERGDGNHDDQEKDDGCEGSGACLRAESIFKHVDEGEARGGSDGLLEIANAKKVGDEQAKGHGDIEDKRPHHGSRNDGGCALNFLGHVGDGIRTEHGKHGGDLADHDRECSRRPVSAVGENGEDVRSGLLGGEDQQDDNDREEGEDVNGNEDTFGEGKALRGEDVEECNSDNGGPDEEGTLPAGGHVIGVVQNDHSLDHDADDIGIDGDEALPRDCRQPSGEVAEQLLVLWRSKFGNPMVLTTSRRGH